MFKLFKNLTNGSSSIVVYTNDTTLIESVTVRLNELESRMTKISETNNTNTVKIEEILTRLETLETIENNYQNVLNKLTTIENSLRQYGDTITNIQNTLNQIILGSDTTIVYTNDVSTVFVERMNNVEQELRDMKIITLRIGDNDIFVLAPPNYGQHDFNPEIEINQ